MIIRSIVAGVLLAWGLPVHGQMEAGQPVPAGIQIDHPLRDPEISQGADGYFYLTGTDGTPSAPEHGEVSFENNDGIRLWRSKDLKSWEPLGRVFDLVTYPPKPELTQPWWRFPTVRPGEAFSPLVRAAHAPHYHEFDGQSLIVFSLNGQGVALLKADQPEGPYELLCPPAQAHHGAMVRPIVHAGGQPSLFVDDGQLYLLWGRGWIAPLTPDGTQLAGPPHQLRCAGDPQTPHHPWTVGTEGFQMLRDNDRYILVATELEVREGQPVRAVYGAGSNKLQGPYGRRIRLLEVSGNPGFFIDSHGQWQAVFARETSPSTDGQFSFAVVPVDLKKIQP